MSQSDFNISDQPGASFLVELNQQLSAIVSNSSGTSEPTTTYAYQFWADTTTGILKIRNAADLAWVSLLNLATGQLISGTFKDDVLVLQDNSDATKQVSFQLSALTTAITRTFTFPDKSGTFAMLDDLNNIGVFGLFRKADPSIVAFSKTGNFTVSTASILYVEVNGALKTIASGTAVTMPSSPAAGTDYAIWAKTDGTLEATTNHTSPPTANARKVGGFHYAPGGHSGVSGGGNTTPQINQYSIWDLKFRPSCADLRGMTLVADGFWADIYLLGVDHLTNGTSKFNVTMADGASPPKIPTKFGGNGTTAYSSLNWWEACEVLKHHGKRSPTYSEFAALAFGTTEASSIGTDPVTTSFSATYFSKWGINQASGVLWVWGDEFGGGAAAAGWVANTGGRGSSYQMENAAIFGGAWNDAALCGSRCSSWSNSPTVSSVVIGARGVADHLQLD
jgi:hypothetical protein